MNEIARISYQTYLALKGQRYPEILKLIHEEGEARMALSPTIVPNEISEIFESLHKNYKDLGMKMCGAGGGGCFILVHRSEDKTSIEKEIEKTPMKVLDFKIEAPISL